VLDHLGEPDRRRSGYAWAMRDKLAVMNTRAIAILALIIAVIVLLILLL
jgi:hypothetical protein